MHGGPLPKHPAARARRNQRSTRAVLTAPAPADVKIPPLPRRTAGWTGMTRAWWRDVWSSPMGPEFDDSDIHALWLLAAIVDDFWLAESSKERTVLAAEIRQQSVRFGLSPMDRRRLEWQIEQTAEAKAKGEKRRGATPPREREANQQGDQPEVRPSARDPRGILGSVQ